jgi:hypothetical protein
VSTLLVGAQEIKTWPIGFLNIPNPTQYEYGPTIIAENGKYYAFYCSPGNGQYWDQIRMISSPDGGTWSDPVSVLLPGNSYDTMSVCDPSVVQFKGVYFLYHTCIDTGNPPDGYKNNRICVAMADSIAGPYYLHSMPVVQNTSCAPTDTAIYCVGQPSAVTFNNSVFLYFTQINSGNMPGPNAGYVYLATSPDGVNFRWVDTPVLLQRDVDVKFDRSSQMFYLVQGDVGDTVITYSYSKDGVHFEPYNRAHAVATNPNLPSGGSNNNPGMASDPDGTFSGMTWVAYGSSYTVGWGDWHLYASGFVVNPTQNDCSTCAAYSCDFQCSRNNGQTAYGYCVAPGSTKGVCCICDAYPMYPNCAKCQPDPVGCVASCRAAKYNTGTCAIGLTPSACCSCSN